MQICSLLNVGFYRENKVLIGHHLNPEGAILIANESHAKRLALMHFGAETYKSPGDRDRVKKLFGQSFPGLIVTSD